MPKRQFKLPYIRVASGLKDTLAQGHPWVYRDAVERAPEDLSDGQWVHVQCGNLQLYGLWDGSGSIAVRLFNSQRSPNRAWVMERIRQAWLLRAPLRAAGEETSAYRWLFGESDGLPGIIVDLYGDVDGGKLWTVVRTYCRCVESLLPWIVDGLQAVVDLAGIVWRKDVETDLLAGDMPPQTLIMLEHGLRYEVDLLHGQKTGFFLDQRDNRRTIGQRSRGKQVLNLFSYTGGFSVAAATGGASHVVSVDSAEPAIEAAVRNFALNGLDPAQHEFVVSDCFDLLERYYGEGRRFDLIVVDPPSFARSRSQLDKALHAYRRLNSLAIQCLVPDGLLASSSCTSQVSVDAFHQMLSLAAMDAKRRLLILHEAGQPLDHPVPVHFPEARYLKFVLTSASPAAS